MTAARTDRALRPSATTGSAPARLIAPAFSGECVIPVTVWPAATNAGTSARPTAPVAPATKMRSQTSRVRGTAAQVGTRCNSRHRRKVAYAEPNTVRRLFAGAKRLDLAHRVVDLQIEIDFPEFGGSPRWRALHAGLLIGGGDLVLADPFFG